MSDETVLIWQGWFVTWDNDTAGYRAGAGSLQTETYTTPEAAVRAAVNGQLEPLPRQPRPEGPRGLSLANKVSRPRIQLDPGPAVLPPEPAPPPELRPRAKQPGKRWRIKLSNGKDEIWQDSLWSRVTRANKRIKSWVNTLPRLNRRMRRALRGRGVGPRLVMLTLTYENNGDGATDCVGWEPNHIREFMLSIRKLLGDKLWAYAWICEMQDRGVPHYHVMLYVAPGTDIPMPDEAGLWKHGLTRRETAKKGPWYLMKYAGKEYQKEGLPHGARMFAVWIGKDHATPDELFGFRLSSAPPWLQVILEETRNIAGPGIRWRRAPGGGWLIVDTGEIVVGEWYIVSCEPYERDKKRNEIPLDPVET